MKGCWYLKEYPTILLLLASRQKVASAEPFENRHLISGATIIKTTHLQHVTANGWFANSGVREALGNFNTFIISLCSLYFKEIILTGK